MIGGTIVGASNEIFETFLIFVSPRGSSEASSSLYVSSLSCMDMCRILAGNDSVLDAEGCRDLIERFVIDSARWVLEFLKFVLATDIMDVVRSLSFLIDRLKSLFTL